jgi:soluble cytochrome b562
LDNEWATCLNLVFTLCFGLLLSLNAEAQKLPGNIALHIAKVHYEHPVRLLHPFLDVWHMKGPLAEKAALKALQKRFAEVSDCNSNANVVVLIEPHMFYNAQLRVFHAEIIARAYVNTTDLSTQSAITTIKKQAQQNGELSIKPDFYMEKAYQKTMDKIIKKLDTDKAFLATLDANKIENPKLICNALDDMPVSKIYY